MVGKDFKNRRVGNLVKPVAVGEPAAAGKTVARQAQVPDAERGRVVHENLENRRMQVQVQVAVEGVEREAGGVEPGKLGVNFGAELGAQAAVEEIIQAGADSRAAEFAAHIDEAGN